MRYCPECGNETVYDTKLRRFVCKGCGLSLSSQERMEIKDNQKPNTAKAAEDRKKKRREYLKWWLSKKG